MVLRSDKHDDVDVSIELRVDDGITESSSRLVNSDFGLLLFFIISSSFSV
jgi:hypothetical protein